MASDTVANPIPVALVAKARVKTDPRDALMLARLFAAVLLPQDQGLGDGEAGLRFLVGPDRLVEVHIGREDLFAAAF